MMFFPGPHRSSRTILELRSGKSRKQNSNQNFVIGSSLSLPLIISNFFQCVIFCLKNVICMYVNVIALRCMYQVLFRPFVGQYLANKMNEKCRYENFQRSSLIPFYHQDHVTRMGALWGPLFLLYPSHLSLAGDPLSPAVPFT